jgi:hypothetical protein
MLQHEFNKLIGDTDEILSRLIIYSKGFLDDVNTQTLKHHADDLIGVGGAILEHLRERIRLGSEMLSKE